MLGSYHPIPVLFTCGIALQCVMIVLESTEKRGILIQPYRNVSRETTSGIVNRSLFFWLTSLFITGYRGILSLKDLYPLDSQLRSQQLHEALQRAWERGKYHVENPPPLLHISVVAFWTD